MIIDTHSQVRTKESMDPYRQDLLGGLTGIFGRQTEVSIEENLRDMDEAGVEKSIIVAIDAETVSHFKVSNDLIAKIVNKDPKRFLGFAGVDPHKGVLAIDELERAIKTLGLKGLKIIPNLIEVYPNEKLMYPIYERVAELNIPILFHAGTLFHKGTKIKYSQPIFFDDVAVDFPNLKIIMAHFGFPWFVEAIAVAQRNQNVFLNIAGWSPKYIPEMVVKYMDGLLSHKVLFGSDYPLIPRKRIIKELEKLHLKQESLDNILSKNAKRLLNIESI
jgi:predicted TIM-barrel fold metal-dependent hydrolase